jgi:hypothetical protein
MSGRVLRKLASENDVLGEIVAPVLEVMETPDPESCSRACLRPSATSTASPALPEL